MQQSLTVVDQAVLDQATYAFMSAVAAWAYTGITLVIAVVGLYQLRKLRESVAEAAKTRSASVLFEIYRIMESSRPKCKQLESFPADFSTWSADKDALAYDVGIELQRVSFLCVKGLIDPDFVKDGWAPMICRMWTRLEGHVKRLRERNGEPRELTDGAFSRKDFEVFAKECEKYVQERKLSFGTFSG